MVHFSGNAFGLDIVIGVTDTFEHFLKDKNENLEPS